MNPFDQQSDKDGKQTGLMLAANRQHPGLLKRMVPSAAEARRNNRETGLKPALGQTHQETGVIKIPEEFHDAVCVLAKKLSKGIYYRETGQPFPDDGCLLINWFTNADLLRTGKYVMFDLLKELGGTAPLLQRGGTYLNDQFEYKLSLSPEKDILVLQANFGKAFGFVVFGSALQGKLESIVTRLRDQSQHNDPFAVLQSPSLS